MGWWGFPWGPIFSIQSLVVNLKGGKDLTAAISASLPQTTPPKAFAVKA
jgi:hypothetical protein